MTDAATSLSDYRRHMAENTAEAIGDILWFTIAGAQVRETDLKDWFTELGLDDRHLPKPIKPVDAFRVATSHATFTYDLPGDGESAELMVREVDTSGEMVTRHIMREVRDRRNKRLSYEQVGEAIFYRQGRVAKAAGAGGESVRFSITARVTDDRERKLIRDFIEGVNRRYHELCTFLQSQALRAVIRDYVNSLNAVQLRPSGGLYFVHKSRRNTIASLAELIARFGGECMFHTVPLPDTGKQRQMLTEAFQDEIEKTCTNLLRTVADANERYAKREVPAGVYAKVQAEMTDAMQRTEEYTKVLGLAQGRAGQALEVALDAVMDMATRIEGSKA